MAMAQAEDSAQQKPAPGGVTQKIANAHSLLLEIQEAVGSKFPKEGEAFAQVAQAFQAAVDALGASPEQDPNASGVGTTTPEQGAAQVQQAL